MFARIRAPIENKADAVLVPDTVIGRDQAGTYVLTVGTDNVVRRTAIQQGQLVGTMRVVDAGLIGGDLVIVGGLQRAVPGSKVTPQPGESPAAETPSGAGETSPGVKSGG